MYADMDAGVVLGGIDSGVHSLLRVGLGGTNLRVHHFLEVVLGSMESRVRFSVPGGCIKKGKTLQG